MAYPFRFPEEKECVYCIYKSFDLQLQNIRDIERENN